VNGIYELPFGRGRLIGGNASGWLDTIIGGWQVSGIYNYRSGLPFSITTGSFPVGFVVNSPAVLNSTNTRALRERIRDASGGTIQFFADPKAVFDPDNPTSGAVRYTRNGEFGNRNTLFSSGFWNLDTAVQKSFRMPWSESHELKVIWQSFNAFNHNSFGLPSATITAVTFGQITSSSSIPREMQFALRYKF